MRRFDMYVPEDLPDLLHYLDTHQSGVHLIANGSDLINRIQRREINPKTLIDLSGLKEFNYVKKDGNVIRIGALTTISNLTDSPVIDSRHEVFREVAAKFGGPSIINVATVGGNICAASSSEDLLPVLLVLDAQVRMRSTQGERVMRLEDFLKGKRVTDLKPNEILVETTFKALDEQSACAFEKIGMRNSLIIAFVNSAVYIKAERETKRVEEIRIAFNRVGGKTPQRAKKTEEKLHGQILSAEAVEDAVSALRSELKLSSDFRVSGEYRTDVAGVLFRRALGRCADTLLGEKMFV
ncbi:MAG: FAD binding domain-containing protein [Candidatus Bathyarchaeia archaeon]|jgi:CO/xanthine dehydrogenase FAD-binding subunit